MEILLCILYTVVFVVLIRRMNFFVIEGHSKNILPGIFFLKICFGLFLWALYTFYYTHRTTADIFKYFDDSRYISKSFFSHPLDFLRMIFGIGDNNERISANYAKMFNWYKQFDNELYNDNRTMIRYNAVLRIFSFGYYNVHTIFTCFLSLCGLTAIYKTFVLCFREKKKSLLFAVFLLPSVLLWGSGVLKEGLLFFETGMLVYFFFQTMYSGITWKRIILISCFIFSIAITKIYILMAFVPCFAAELWYFRTGQKSALPKYLVVFGTCFLLIFVIFPMLKFQDPVKTLSVKQLDFINLSNGGIFLINDSNVVYFKPEDRTFIEKTADSIHYIIKQGSSYLQWEKDRPADTLFITKSTDKSLFELFGDNPRSGSRIEIPRLEPNLWSLIKNIPSAFRNVLLRPYPWESKSLLLVLAGLENILILLVIILSFIFFDRNFKEFHFVYFCLGFVVIIFVLTGLVTPVLGAVVRYKTPALPFLVIALVLMTRNRKQG